MLQAGEDGEYGSTVTDLLSSGRVTRMNEVSIITRGIGLFESFLFDGTQLPCYGYEMHEHSVIRINRG